MLLLNHSPQLLAHKGIQRFHLEVHGDVGGYDGDGGDGEHHNVHHRLWAVSLQSKGYQQSSIQRIIPHYLPELCSFACVSEVWGVGN